MFIVIPLFYKSCHFKVKCISYTVSERFFHTWFSLSKSVNNRNRISLLSVFHIAILCYIAHEVCVLNTANLMRCNLILLLLIFHVLHVFNVIFIKCYQ